MAHQRILVIGGAGYIGRVLVEQLRLKNFEVTVLSRKPVPDYQDRNIVCDVLDREELLKNVHDFDLVVDLASVVRTVVKSRYQENISGLENIIEAMEANGIKRLIYLSSQNVNLVQKGYYAQSKVKCEEILQKSSLDYVIIRPSIVYGIDRRNDFYRLAKLIKKWRLAPLIGSGKNRMQPVFVGDLVQEIILTFNDVDSNRVIEVNGKETVSMNQVIDSIGESLGINPVKIHIPFFILKVLKRCIPFDIDGYTEDRISINNIENSRYSSFFENLGKITDLVK